MIDEGDEQLTPLVPEVAWFCEEFPRSLLLAIGDRAFRIGKLGQNISWGTLLVPSSFSAGLLDWRAG